MNFTLNDLTNIGILIVVTGMIAFSATWIVRGAMRKLDIMDRPTDSRKFHKEPVAYEGGLAIWFASTMGLLLAYYIRPTFIFDINAFYATIVGGAIVVAIGVLDDIADLRPVAKLAAQFAIGAFMYYYGFRIERITNPLGGNLEVYWLISLAITCFWYALLMNAINMIDGLDGLAAGIVAISAITLGAIAFELRMELAFFLCVILFASCCGFLPFNFKPATIFMGDAGSLYLGFIMATITLMSSSKAPAFLALIIPMMAIGIPLFDTGFAFFRRLCKGQHPFKADKRHLHHRFLVLGLTERRTVLAFYYITAYFGVTAYVLQKLDAKVTLPLIIIIGIGMLLLIENMRFLEKSFSKHLHHSGNDDILPAQKEVNNKSAEPQPMESIPHSE